MGYHLDITDEAADVLLTTAKWYADRSQSLEVAATWYDGFIDLLEKLEEQPQLGSLAPENAKFPFELRQISYGSGTGLTHRALYRIVGNKVQILSIRHLAQRPVTSDDL